MFATARQNGGGAYRGARQALRLRGWALELLSAPADARLPPEVPAAAWDLFLRAEGCALPLRAAVRRGAIAGWLEGPAAAVLNERATIELQRVLSARALLRTLATIAVREGWTVVLLKGGVAVGAGHDLDLVDLDLYAERPQAEAIAAALDARGYGPSGGPGSHRLAVRRGDNVLPVEVHFAVPGAAPGEDYLARAEPCPGVPGMLKLAPADHLWQAMLHVVAYHRERRARIRDLLLVGHALADCPSAARDDVERRTAAHSLADPLRRLVALALALRGEGELHDPFRAMAAGAYLLRGWLYPFDFSELVVGRVQVSVFARLAGDREAAHALLDPGLGLAHASGHRALAWLHRRAPALDGAVRRFVRSAPLWLLAPLAVPVVAAARRLAREPAPEGERTGAAAPAGDG